MKLNFDITRSEYDIVKDILVRHLPQNCKIWVFGSRSKNKTRFNSDLDLALQDIKPLPQTIMIDLKEDFSESSLPYTVDIVDMNNIATDFKQIVEKQAIEFPIEKTPTTPKIRFPEFKDSGAWEEKRLGEVCESISNGLSVTQLNESLDGVLVTRIETISDGEINLKKTGIVKNFNGIDKYKLQIGDILFSNINSVKHIGKCAIVDKNLDLYHGMNLLRIQLNQKICNPRFVFYILRTDKIKRLFEKICNQAVSQASINQTDLAKIKISLPSLPEQQKIADFLTAIDEKIGLLTKEHSLWQAYKKGMMQKIFSQSFRFTDDNGNPYPDWIDKKLGEVLEQKIREIEKPNTLYLALGIRSHAKGIFQKPNFEPEKIAMDKLYIVHENDLVVNITFAWEGAIAVASKGDHGGLVSHRFPTYVCKENCLIDFLKYVVTDKKFITLLELISPGGAGRNRVLSKKDFIKIKISLPSLPEQQKIADFLTAIDEKINLVKQQLDKTTDFKKGLLQKMFV